MIGYFHSVYLGFTLVLYSDPMIYW